MQINSTIEIIGAGVVLGTLIFNAGVAWKTYKNAVTKSELENVKLVAKLEILQLAEGRYVTKEMCTVKHEGGV